MMKENFLRRGWEIPQQPELQHERDGEVAPKQRWLKSLKSSLTVKSPTDGSASAFSKASPMVLFCLLLVLIFLIGAVIAIALIPLYLQNKSVERFIEKDSNKKNVTLEIDVPDSLPVGPLSDAELTKMLDVIKASLPESVLHNGNMRIIGAEVILVPITERRSVRQVRFKKVLRLIFELVAAIQAIGQALQGAQAVQVLQSIQAAVTTAVINSVQIIQQTVIEVIENRPSTTSTSTVPSNLVSTVAPGRRRREEPQQTQRPLVTYED